MRTLFSDGLEVLSETLDARQQDNHRRHWVKTLILQHKVQNLVSARPCRSATPNSWCREGRAIYTPPRTRAENAPGDSQPLDRCMHMQLHQRFEIVQQQKNTRPTL